MGGNYLLAMYYTTITGWLLLYFCKTLRGDFNGLDATAVGKQFGNLMNQPLTMFIFMAITVMKINIVSGWFIRLPIYDSHRES